MRVIVGGWTCSARQSSRIVSEPWRSADESAESIEGVTPASASCRSLRASRVTPRRSRAARAVASTGAIVGTLP